jgi:hypothetical protein
METKAIWFEVTVAGMVYTAAMVLGIFAAFGLPTFPDVKTMPSYLPYTSALFIGVSYLVGLCAHYAIPVLGGRIILQSLRRWLRSRIDPVPSRDPASIAVRAILYGKETLYQMRSRIYNTLVLFRLLASGFLLAGLSGGCLVHRCSAGPVWVLPILGGVALSIFFMWMYRLQYPSYALTEDATTKEIEKLILLKTSANVNCS